MAGQIGGDDGLIAEVFDRAEFGFGLAVPFGACWQKPRISCDVAQACRRAESSTSPPRALRPRRRACQVPLTAPSSAMIFSGGGSRSPKSDAALAYERARWSAGSGGGLDRQRARSRRPVRRLRPARALALTETKAADRRWQTPSGGQPLAGELRAAAGSSSLRENAFRAGYFGVHLRPGSGYHLRRHRLRPTIRKLVEIQRQSAAGLVFAELLQKRHSFHWRQPSRREQRLTLPRTKGDAQPTRLYSTRDAVTHDRSGSHRRLLTGRGAKILSAPCVFAALFVLNVGDEGGDRGFGALGLGFGHSVAFLHRNRASGSWAIRRRAIVPAGYRDRNAAAMCG